MINQFRIFFYYCPHPCQCCLWGLKPITVVIAAGIVEERVGVRMMVDLLVRCGGGGRNEDNLFNDNAVVATDNKNAPDPEEHYCSQPCSHSHSFLSLYCCSPLLQISIMVN